MKQLITILTALVLFGCGDDGTTNVQHVVITYGQLQDVCGEPCMGAAVWSYDADKTTCIIYTLDPIAYETQARFTEQLGIQYYECIK